MLTNLIIGAGLATVLVAYARSRPSAEPRIFAVGLVVAALIYVLFALLGSAGAQWTAIELLGFLVFAGFAWLGLRRSALWLVSGWLAHAIWDMGLHGLAPTPVFVPALYPVLCVSFDVLVAAAIMAHRSERLRSCNCGLAAHERL